MCLRPNVILAIGGDVAEFAKKATQTIPLVFISSADPGQLGIEFSVRMQRMIPIAFQSHSLKGR